MKLAASDWTETFVHRVSRLLNAHAFQLLELQLQQSDLLSAGMVYTRGTIAWYPELLDQLSNMSK